MPQISTGCSGKRRTYNTPGFKANGPTGLEGPIIQVAGFPIFVTSLQVYLSSAVAAARFIQLFDVSVIQTPANVTNFTYPGSDDGTWNPAIPPLQVQPGQLLTWIPAVELVGRFQNVKCGHIEEVMGFPFDRGLGIADSTSDVGFTTPNAAEIRITVRYVMGVDFF